jgi:TonB family protein
MSAMARRASYVVSLVAAFSFTCLSISLCAEGQDASQYLRDQYLHKTFILRSFYTGNSLRYDAAGVSQEEANAGDWTTDGVVRIDDIGISGNRLLIRGSRIYLGWDKDKGLIEVRDITAKAKADKRSRVLRIEAELGAGAGTDNAADAAFAHVFLTSQDSFVDLVPDYWTHCVRTALGITKDREASQCQFSKEFLAIPGVAAKSDSEPVAEPEPASAWEPGHYPHPFHPREGQKLPRAVYQPTPEFSEPARRAKFQGVVTLKLVVDEEGRPNHIRVVNPLGCGLDAKAVQAVENWKFSPAEKDNVPVAAGIAVEVDFHLY